MSDVEKKGVALDKDHPETETSKTKVTSAVPEKADEGQINPSSPGNTGTTPGTNAKVG